MNIEETHITIYVFYLNLYYVITWFSTCNCIVFWHIVYSMFVLNLWISFCIFKSMNMVNISQSSNLFEFIIVLMISFETLSIYMFKILNACIWACLQYILFYVCVRVLINFSFNSTLLIELFISFDFNLFIC